MREPVKIRSAYFNKALTKSVRRRIPDDRGPAPLLLKTGFIKKYHTRTVVFF
jgi:hypothetical protein